MDFFENLIFCVSLGNKFIWSNVCDVCNYISEDVDAPEEDSFVEELVVVVKQDRGVVHRREADRWDSHLTSEHVQQWKEKGKCWKENLFRRIFTSRK